MSDPVSNAEVEDVLSSIRRLVSEDKRPLQARMQNPRKTESDRLVLTPSLRVAEDTSDPATAEGTPDKVNQNAAEDVEIPDLSDLLDDGAEVSFEETEDDEVVAVEAQEPSASDLADDYSADPYNFDEDDQDSDPDDVASGQDVEDWHSVEDDAEQPSGRAEETSDIEQTDYVSALSARANEARDHLDTPREATLSAKIEALETAIGKIPDRWEPDGKGTDDYAGTEPRGMAWADDSDDDVAEPAEDDMAFAPEHADEPEESDDVEAHSDGESDAQGEGQSVTLDGEDMGDIDLAEAEPDLPPEPVSEPEPQQAEVHRPTLELPIPPRPMIRAEQDAKYQDPPRRTVATTGVFDDAFDDSGDSQLLDEEALRDMVSEIVRAELQGALGERITRNVRKLVRREIHRALTAQDLE